MGPPVNLPYDGTYVWTVDPGPGLEGELVGGADDKPIAGATVYALHKGYQDRPFALARTESDETGAFHLPVGGRGTEVLVVAAGLAPAWVEVVDESDLGTIRLARTVTVTGWVTGPDGRPRPDVVVHAEPRWPHGADRPALTTRTDATGLYVLSDIPPGEVRLFVCTDDWIFPRMEEGWCGAFDSLVIESLPGETRRLDLSVGSAARIRGRVLDASGACVPGALVRASAGWISSHVATDEDGRFEFGGMTAGSICDLCAMASGRMDAVLGDVPARVDGEPVELWFEETFHVPVTVVTGEADEPVVGARVRVSQTFKVVGGSRTTYVPDAWTDARGRARVGPLEAASARMEVSAPGLGSAERDITVGPGVAEHVCLDLACLDPGLTIRGRVIAPPGVGLGPVDLRRSEPDEVLLGRWVKNGGTPVTIRPDGFFEVEVPSPGCYGLRAEMERDGQVYWAQVSSVAGVTDIEIHLRPAPWTCPARRTWSFRIVDGKGHPVAGGTAVGDVRGRNGCRSVERAYRAGRLEVAADSGTLDAAWVFRDAVDACGLWLPFGPARSERVAPGGAPIEVVLPPEEEIRGVVVGPHGRGVRGVRVWARPITDADDGLFERSALTRDDGHFRLGGLGDELHVLRLDVPLRMARVERFLVEAGRGRYTDVRIGLHEAVAPRVLVRGPDGEPLAGAQLRIEPDEGDFWTFMDNVVIEGFYSGPGFVYESTDAGGWGGFTKLDPQRGYVLWVSPPEGHADLAPVYHLAWRPKATQEIRLAPWATVRGVVQDAAGVPVEGATVWVGQPGDYELEQRAESAADGRFSVERLRPGAVALVAADGIGYPAFHSVPGLLHTTTSAGNVILVMMP